MRPPQLLLSLILLPPLATLVSAKFSIFDDPFASPKYRIKLSNPIPQDSVPGLIKDNYTYDYLHDSQGKYICEIPIHQPIETTNDTAHAHHELNSTIHNKIIHDSLSNIQSLTYVDTYKFWTYEYVPKSSFLAQYHFSGPFKKDLQYALGRSSTSPLTIDRESRSMATTLTNGSYCELIASPRSVDVHYMCNDEADPKVRLISVKEYRTCQYVALVHIPQLCQFEFFQNSNQVSPISCYPIQRAEEEQSRTMMMKDNEDGDDHDDDDDVSFKINILEYPRLIKFGNGLFLGKKSPTDIVLINTFTNTEEFAERLVNFAFNLLSVLNVLPEKSTTTTTITTNDFISHLILKNQIFNFKSNVFDIYGNYWSSVHLTLSKHVDNNKGGQPKNDVLILVKFVSHQEVSNQDAAVYFTDYEDEDNDNDNGDVFNANEENITGGAAEDAAGAGIANSETETVVVTIQETSTVDPLTMEPHAPDHDEL